MIMLSFFGKNKKMWYNYKYSIIPQGQKTFLSDDQILERGIIMLNNNNVYAKLKDALDRSIDSRLMGTRKSILMSGLHSLGYMGSVLLFHKANVSDIRVGDTPVEGWFIQEIIKNPAKNAVDGMVICLKK